MDVEWRVRDIFDGRGEPFVLPAKPPTVAEAFALWAEQKSEAATTRKALYGVMVVMAHRYFADIRKHADEQGALHRAYQAAFERLEDRLLELDPLLPDSVVEQAPSEPAQAAGVFYMTVDDVP